MHAQHHQHDSWQRRFNSALFAILVIVVGFFFLGRNLNFISDYIFHLFISWQMLLIVLGVSSLIKRNFSSAIALLTVGAFFLLPKITGIEGGLFGQFWPVLIIVAGVALLFKKHNRYNASFKHTRIDSNTKDGYVSSDVSFGNSQHIVLDPVFKGANLDIAFGNIILDLRRTTLEGEQTVIDLNCSFGSVELFIPSTWNVQMEVDAAMSGTKDKRLQTIDMDYHHKLIVRGDLSFGNLEIKN